jgi:hypothetical protein
MRSQAETAVNRGKFKARLPTPKLLLNRALVQLQALTHGAFTRAAAAMAGWIRV